MLSEPPSSTNPPTFVSVPPVTMSPTGGIDHGGGHLLDNHIYRGLSGLEKTTCLSSIIITNLSCLRFVHHHIVVLFLVIALLVPYINTCYVYPPDVVDPCSNKECSFGAHCVPSLDGLTARCQCLQICNRYGDSDGSTPVCGSDGIVYLNECEMRRASCTNMREVFVKYAGQCGKYFV